MSKRRATISDIAMSAGVSKTTVSRFINGQIELISPATRRRIERAIKLADYHPSSAARSLKARDSDVICLVVLTFEAQGTGAFLQHAAHALMDNGHTAVIVGPCDTPEAFDKQISVLAGLHPAGILVVGEFSQKDLETLRSSVSAPVLPCSDNTGKEAADALLILMANSN